MDSIVGCKFSNSNNYCNFHVFYETDARRNGRQRWPYELWSSKAKLLEGGKVKTTFADVAGVEEAKEEVQGTSRFLERSFKISKIRRKDSSRNFNGWISWNR